MMAAIRPAGKPAGHLGAPEGPDRRRASAARRPRSARWPRRPAPTAGSLGKLGDVRYWFNWEGERVFKVVSFFLVRYEGGRLGDVPPEHRHEVAEVRWLPLDDAPQLLAYAASGRWPARRSSAYDRRAVPPSR